MIDMTDLLITELPLAATPDTFQLPPPSPEEAAALARMGTLSFSPTTTTPVTEDVPPSVPAGYQDPDITLDALLHQPTSPNAFQVPPSAKEEPSLIPLVLSLQQQIADLTALVRSQQETMYSTIEETVQEAMVQMLPPSVLHQEPLSSDDQAAVDSFSVPSVPLVQSTNVPVQEAVPFVPHQVQTSVPAIQEVQDFVQQEVQGTMYTDVPEVQEAVQKDVQESFVHDNPLFVPEEVHADNLHVSVLGDGRLRIKYKGKQYNSHKDESHDDFVARIVLFLNKGLATVIE